MSIKTNRYGPIKSDIVVVGIDVAKRRHVAAIRLPDGSISRPFGFQNNRQGFERLVCGAEAALAASGSDEVGFHLSLPVIMAVAEIGPRGGMMGNWLIAGSTNEVSVKPGAVH